MPILIGLEKFESKLKELALTVQRKVLIQATRKGAELIRAEAEARAPRTTGKLSENIIVVLRNSENTADEITVRIGPSMKVFYGLFEELGTAHATGHPFLRPAFDAKKDDALQITSQEFLAAIEEVAEKAG